MDMAHFHQQPNVSLYQQPPFSTAHGLSTSQQSQHQQHLGVQDPHLGQLPVQQQQQQQQRQQPQTLQNMQVGDTMTVGGVTIKRERTVPEEEGVLRTSVRSTITTTR